MRSLIPVLLLGACGETDAPPVEDDVVVELLSQVVPGPGLPDDVEVQPANNNLDVAVYDGRVFLAWRTAPSHFASERAVMHVVSSDDEVTWRHEGTFALGRDVREPQLVPTDEGLWLYFATLGVDPLDFEPGGVRRTLRRGPGDWTEPEPFGDEGLIAWRIKPLRDGRWHLFGYTGGENIYDPEADPLEIRWYASDDGVTWGPAVGDDPVVLVGGGSETDAELLEDGSLVAVVRNEGGDADGFGSKVCTAPAGDLGTWTCAPDPRKYDSPLMLRGREGVWLIARRQVANDGLFDLGRDDLDFGEQYLAYQGAYWQTPKRCSLWRVDPAAREVTFAADLPSRGDTCFADALDRGDGAYTVYNYSNDPDGPELSWIEGQTGSTNIYRVAVDLP